jgi:14-3-3 protein epsilon
MATSFSSFDIDALQANGPFDKDQLIFLARTAEGAERYEDMCHFMSLRVTNFKSDELCVEHRNLLSVAYKNVIGSRRSAWRRILADVEMDGSSDESLLLYKKQIENELETISLAILKLLEDDLIDAESTDVEAQVFYLKMAGDYYRYLTEGLTDGPNYQQYKDNTKKFYQLASDKVTDLPPTHPIRLGLALNYSVCYYEILGEPVLACSLAKEAFDAAISKLDELSEADYKDSTLIMQLLRDNLTLWTSQNEDDVAVEDIEN